MKSPYLETKYEGMTQYARGVQRLIRIAGSIGIAALLTTGLKKEDFKDDPYGNHFVKMGNLWINMEYFSAISPALAGFMYNKAKSTPKTNALGHAGLYAHGALVGLNSVPGIDEGEKIISAITNPNPEKGLVKYA